METITAAAIVRPIANVLGSIAGKTVAKKWNRSRIARRLEQEQAQQFTPQQHEVIESLALSKSAKLAEFVQSVTYQNLVVRYVVALIRDGSDDARLQAQSELKGLLRLNLNIDHVEAEVLSGVIIEHLYRHVQVYLSESRQVDFLPENFVGASVARAATLKATTVSNATILNQLIDLAPVNLFVDTYRDQATHHFGSILVPSSATRKHAPVEHLFVMPDVKDVESNQPVDLSLVMGEGGRNLLLKGDPGGGKSTLARYLTYQLAQGTQDWGGFYRVPFFLVLRNFASAMIEHSRTISQQIGLDCRATFNVEPPDNAIDYLLLNGIGAVILDGLDELTDIALRERVVTSVHTFCTRYPDVPVMVTSRKIGYEVVPLDARSFRAFEIDGLGHLAILGYAEKWFAIDDQGPADGVDPAQRADALVTLTEDIADIRSNPLMLALICSLYSWEGYIPNNRPDLYEQCSKYLYQQWDLSRNIETRKLDASVRNSIYALANWMLEDERPGYTKRQVETFLCEFFLNRRTDDEEQARDLAESFVAYCTGRAWVLTDVGADKTNPLYHFTHRTFMEYFAAKQITRRNPTPEQLLNFLLPWIDASQREVVCQICMQVLRDNQEDGVDQFLNRLLDLGADDGEPSAARVAFAVRALQSAVPDPDTRRRVAELALNSRDRAILLDLLCSNADNLPVVSATLRAHLENIASADIDTTLAPAVLYTRAFAASNRSAYSPTIHGRFWHEQAAELRAQAWPKIDASDCPVSKAHWVRLFRFAQGLPGARASQLSPSGLLEPNTPFPTVLEPLTTRLLWAMCGSDEFICDDVIIGSTIGADDARAITASLLSTAPIRNVAPGARSARFKPAQLELSTGVSDPDVIGLYVVLSAAEVDLRHANRDPDAVDRLAYWHQLTAGRFEGKAWNEFLEVPVGVRRFLQSWLGTGRRIVDRE